MTNYTVNCLYILGNICLTTYKHCVSLYYLLYYYVVKVELFRFA